MNIPDPRERPTINAAEVASIWSVSEWSVYEMTRNGTCPVPPLRLGRALRWPTRLVLASVGLDDEGAPTRGADVAALASTRHEGDDGWMLAES